MSHLAWTRANSGLFWGEKRKLLSKGTVTTLSKTCGSHPLRGARITGYQVARESSPLPGDGMRWGQEAPSPAPQPPAPPLYLWNSWTAATTLSGISCGSWGETMSSFSWACSRSTRGSSAASAARVACSTNEPEGGGEAPGQDRAWVQSDEHGGRERVSQGENRQGLGPAPPPPDP